MINTPDRQNNRKIVAMDDTLADPLTGRMLDGRYAVTARIAHGGMATVYQATDTRLDRQVALKVMHAELARDEEFVRRFIGEAKSVARLSHQNVVAVFDQGADGPFLYLAMEYVSGRTLKELLRDSGRFSPASALEIMTGVLDGLAAAHASGIVHRDVKPENVLLTADGRIKVADFGLARAQSAAGHTRAGLLIGTVAYVPPEQVTGGTTGPGGDVYSAGVMLFELLTGRLPFTGDTPLSVAYQHVNSGVPAPSTLVPGADRPPVSRGGLGGIVPPGIVGVGVEGLGEAPWLDLDTPAATDGWWARDATLPPISVHDLAPSGPQPVSQVSTDPLAHGGNSHTLVVHREDGGRYRGGREPFLGRWLFSPRLIIVVVVVALGVGLGLGGWWLTSGRYVHVPSVAGDNVTQAAAILTADGFTVRQNSRVHSNTVAKGLVVGTSPAGRVSKGTAITLLVSSGPFTSVVPKVRGDTQAAAQAALQRVHLVSTIGKVGSDAPVGTVIGTNPPAGTSWPQTKTVTILVAASPPLPDFTGMNIAAAQQWADAHNVHLQQESDANSQEPAGTVVGQEPAAGSTFQAGQTVVVQVSSGPQLVAVPDPIGMTVEQATQVLQAAGFQVKVNRFGLFEKVFDFSPVGEAPRGSVITLDTGF